jgi:hypothetical protein
MVVILKNSVFHLPQNKFSYLSLVENINKCFPWTSLIYFCYFFWIFRQNKEIYKTECQSSKKMKNQQATFDNEIYYLLKKNQLLVFLFLEPAYR